MLVRIAQHVGGINGLYTTTHSLLEALSSIQPREQAHDPLHSAPEYLRRSFDFLVIDKSALR